MLLLDSSKTLVFFYEASFYSIYEVMSAIFISFWGDVYAIKT